MRDALKPLLHCDEELYNIEFCISLGLARSDMALF